MMMQNLSSKSNTSTYTDDSLDTNIPIKLRRLKIEESVISKSICKSAEDFQEEDEDGSLYSDYKLLLHKARSSFIDIRDLFEEIKDNTGTQNNLKCLDLEDMKKDVMNLETKIHNVKAYLRTQLKYLQENEQQLIKTINQHPNEFDTMRRQPKVKKMPYKEIVSSPVRVLINSPFKCTEVQQFQDFLMNSKNRYGGWIPYNHNIFEKLWHKYFSIQTNTEDIEYQEVDVENSELLPKFLQEMYEKNPEITVTELVAHCKWYSKYIYLKERQQRALEKWKTNRKLIKSSRQSAKTSIAEKKEEISDLNESKLNDAEDDDDINTLVSDEFKKLCNVFSEEIDSSSPKRVAMDSQHETTMKKTVKSFRRNITEAISNRPCLAYRNYTEQWNNRCNDLDDCRHNYLNIENSSLTKRRIPAWRMVLNNE